MSRPILLNLGLFSVEPFPWLSDGLYCAVAVDNNVPQAAFLEQIAAKFSC